MDDNLSTIVQVSRVGSTLTMDMTCYTVEKREDAEKVDIKLAFALATANNVSPAVMNTVVKKLVGCVDTELTGLDWSGTSSQPG